MFNIFIVGILIIVSASGEYYDSFHGVVLTKEQLNKYEKEGNINVCATEIQLPCDPDDWRRIDGSCNNLEHPSYGTVYTPYYRVLEPVFGKDLRDRESEKGGPLPLVRKLRTSILKEGKDVSSTFNQLMTYFLLYSFTDNGSMRDTINYVTSTTYCCEEKGKGDYKCTPHQIPDDDPVHRFSHVRCMNQTRPVTFQTYGCLQNGTTVPARINTETLTFDLSSIYYFQGKPSDRAYRGGQLILEEINGKTWPVSYNSTDDVCILNVKPTENLCFKSTTNGVLGGKFIAILLFRLHNYIARQLAALNPCWDDELLFQTARDINIAIETHIYMYELMSGLMGKRNLIRDGVLSCKPGFRDLYDKNVPPQVSEEYVYGLRYFHTVQETKIKLYDNKGHYTKTYPMTNLTLKTGFFQPDNHFEEITQSSFRQPCARFDHTVDPDISEVGLGPLQYSSDITMNDLAKARTIGFPGFIKYRELCSGKKYNNFEDLLDVMYQDRMEILRESYATPADIDLMAGLWSERKKPGSHVPHTLYCLLVDQLRRFIKTDRFWYEQKDRPHAYTIEQLLEIRKASMAYIMCTVGNSVTEIQKQAFLRIGPKNPLVSCKDIPKIDFTKWKDAECKKC